MSRLAAEPRSSLGVQVHMCVAAAPATVVPNDVTSTRLRVWIAFFNVNARATF